MNRRMFIGLGILLPQTSLFALDGKKKNKKMKMVFLHHAYFWLKDPESKEDLNHLVNGLSDLSKVKTVKAFHIGVPAATRRAGVDHTYSVSWFTQFESAADQDKYQIDPVHIDFVERHKHLWSKVVVYDSIDA